MMILDFPYYPLSSSTILTLIYYDDYEQDLSSLEFQMYGGYGGFGYDTSHVRGDDCEPEIVTAARQGNLDKVKSLVDATTKGKGNDNDMLHRCVLNSSRRWTEVDYKDSGFSQEYEWHHYTPLTAAARFGHVDIVEYLLIQGADPTLRSCPTDNVHLDAMEAAKTGHDNQNATIRGLLEEGYVDRGYSVDWSIQDLLKKLDGDTTAKVLAENLIKKRYTFECSIAVLKAACEFWTSASYSHSSYSKEREQSGFSNSPTSTKDLLAALTAVSQPVEPDSQTITTLSSRIEVFQERKRKREEEAKRKREEEEAKAEAKRARKRQRKQLRRNYANGLL